MSIATDEAKQKFYDLFNEMAESLDEEEFEDFCDYVAEKVNCEEYEDGEGEDDL